VRNKYAGSCVQCGQSVAEGAGYFQRTHSGKCRWIVRCMACVVAGKLAKGDTLSLAQQEHGRRTLRTNYRSGTSGDLNASDMRNIPDQEDDVSEAQEWEDFDRDC